MSTSSANQNNARREPNVRYDALPTLYASQFLLTAQDEQVLLECSPGAGVDRTTGEPVLAVHTRLALNWNAARRLVELLSRVIRERDTWLAKNEPVSATDAAPANNAPVARLPSFEA